MTNDQDNHEPEGFICNIDTASEELQRLEDRLAARENRPAVKRDFIPNIDKANAEIRRMEALLAAAPAPAASAPAPRAEPKPELTASGQPLTGLARLIQGNSTRKTEQPALTGLQRAAKANQALQPKAK